MTAREGRQGRSGSAAGFWGWKVTSDWWEAGGSLQRVSRRAYCWDQAVLPQEPAGIRQRGARGSRLQVILNKRARGRASEAFSEQSLGLARLDDPGGVLFAPDQPPQSESDLFKVLHSQESRNYLTQVSGSLSVSPDVNSYLVCFGSRLVAKNRGRQG